MRPTFVLAMALVALGAMVFGAATLFARPEPVTLTGATATVGPGEAGLLRVFLTMENGGTPNRLVSISSPEAADARLAGRVSGPVALPAGSSPALSLDGIYVELSGVAGDLEEGRLIPVTLTFEPSGAASTRVRIEQPADPHAMHGAMVDMDGTLGADGQSPEMSIMVEASEGGGHDLAVQVAHFTFTPNADTPVHVPGQGHGHLYLNGLKLGRVYSESLTIGALPPGIHELEVTLNTNTHQPYMTPTGPVTATATVVVD